MQTYQQTGMAYLGQQASKLALVGVVVLAGCASPTVTEEPQEPIIKYKERERIHRFEKIERIQEKPFKVCPDEPKDDDYPCVKLGPTKTLGVQGYYAPR